MKSFEPATPKFPHMLHGGDYNPEQWQNHPDIIERDIELMKKADINCVSVGIFSWAELEPEKDVFTFEWLDSVIDKLWANGIHVILATPSGSRPQWLAEEFPEVLRVGENGVRNIYGQRHNHCYNSLAYRERVRIIDTKLAERYSGHPAVILWHISNEFGGECHCETCQKEFRRWVRRKYGTLENLNYAWWARFWSHTYTRWEQVHSPTYIGETSVQGLYLDWKRFVTDSTIGFMREEINAVKSVDPSIPVTANLMGIYSYGLDYFKFKDELDVISWDSYPEWHSPCGNAVIARNESLSHDMMRSVKGRPFLLMECTPSTTNWRPVSKLKKPGMHKLSVLNAVAHGADSGLYFQIRQSRGSAEKFHSAVISHTGTENTRVFREVAETGAALNTLSEEVYGSGTPAQTAIIFDTENKWALDKCQGPRNAGIDYFGEIQKNYDYFWHNGINVDVVDSTYDFSGYKLVIAPMLYMFRSGIQDKLREFVQNGGTLVTTAFSGIADENDLCFLGEDTKEKLSDVLGMWVEETDSLYDGEYNSMKFAGREYRLSELCEIVHPVTCEVLSEYERDYYRGSPALTRNSFGRGTAYHLCANADAEFHRSFYRQLSEELSLERALDSDIPDGVSVTYRENESGGIVFIQNFGDKAAKISLDGKYAELLTGEVYDGKITVDGLSCAVVKRQ